jgi:hypothetical protein
MRKDRSYEAVGMFEEQWRNPPPPFNPLFDPKAGARYAAVTASMEADDFYTGRTREECRIEWAARYGRLKAEGK